MPFRRPKPTGGMSRNGLLGRRIAREKVEEEEREKAGILYRKTLRKWARDRE
jgi:hypothetical protein